MSTVNKSPSVVEFYEHFKNINSVDEFYEHFKSINEDNITDDALSDDDISISLEWNLNLIFLISEDEILKCIKILTIV